MNKNTRLSKFFRFAITFGVVSLALFLGLMLWESYMNSPWTRDGRVRADVTMVAPDVSGLVSRVAVSDNQHVKAGEVLFEIDSERFHHALSEAEATLEAKKAVLAMRAHQASRRALAGDEVVSRESTEDAAYEAAIARADVEEAHARLESARLDLERSFVRAPAEGWVSNLLLRKGDYVKAGENRLSLINSGTFWVYGYFEEHKLSKIGVGDEAVMNPLGTNVFLRGHVESIARGITDRDNALGERLLANVNPTFTWVRLAQRIPVRIKIDEVPEGFTLAAGMTCSVRINPDQGAR